MATIKDVARESGLSIATISKYINGGPVLERNRARIDAAIAKLGYSVNRAARSLKTNKTMTVGVLLPSLDVSYFAGIISDVEAELIKHGYDTIVASFNRDPSLEMRKLRFLVDKNVDGIIFIAEGVSAGDISGIAQIRDNEIPLVLMDRFIPGQKSDFVLVDCRAACRTAVDLFIENGHRRIAILLGPGVISTASDRLGGYLDAFESSGLTINRSWIRHGEYTVEAGYNMMNELMDMPDPPTAILCTNYELTMGAVNAARERKLNITGDLSLIGFDDMQLTRIFNPPVTIVLQPCADIAKQTTRLLLKRMSGDYSDFPETVRLGARLMMCDSVGKVN